jgi:hypothetical protein
VRYNRLGNGRYNLDGVIYNQPLAADEQPYHKLAQTPILVLDQQRRRLAVLDHLTELVITEEINGEETVDLSIPYEDAKRVYLENENYIQLGQRLYVIRRVHHSRKGSGKRETQVYAEAIWYDLQYTEPMAITQWPDATPYEVIRDILTGTEWRVGRCDIGTVRSMSVD